MAESHLHTDRHSDHQHDVAWDNDDEQFVPAVGFDYGSVDREVFGVEEQEDTVPWSDMSAALSLILGWILASPSLSHCGGRAACLTALLDPTQAPHGRDSLTKITKELNITKAATSKWICDLRDEVDLSGWSIGKK